MPTAAKRKILIFTDRDYGQANVVLSTAYALVRADPNVEVHVASQSGMEGQIKSVIEQAARDLGPAAAEAIKFHHLVGLSQFDAMERPGNMMMKDLTSDPSFINTVGTMTKLPCMSLPWTPEEFLEIYRDVERLWDEIKPDVTVVECFLAPALTFCHHNDSKVRWIILSPNTVKEFAASAQPKLAILWKFPIFCSAFDYPVPLHLIPINILYSVVAIVATVSSKRYARCLTYMKEHIAPDIKIMTVNELGLLQPPPAGIRIMVSNSPDIDFPFEIIPEYVVPCGPLTRPAAPISVEDAELSNWLARGPTVYMNLGTHHCYDVALAREVAYAFRRLFDAVQNSDLGNLQVIWKMPRKSPEGDKDLSTDFLGPWKEIRDILGPQMDRDRVRIVDWIAAEPKSILESGHIICSVNHGGSNSFHEAVCTGIPQVILPGWADCYDFALRAELLGIGKWANRTARPYWERNELAESLEEVLLGPAAKEIRSRAQELRKRHPEAAGRDRAAKEILRLLYDGEAKDKDYVHLAPHEAN